jgi:flagellar biosynthesis component FlhA
LFHIPCAQRSLIDLLPHPLLPTFLYVCLSVCLSIYYQGKRKWKAAKELTKNKKTAKTRSKKKKKKKKKKKNQIGMRKERDALLLLLFLPSFT